MSVANIVIVVEGGLVQNVFCTAGEMPRDRMPSYAVIDWDKFDYPEDIGDDEYEYDYTVAGDECAVFSQRTEDEIRQELANQKARAISLRRASRKGGDDPCNTDKRKS